MEEIITIIIDAVSFLNTLTNINRMLNDRNNFRSDITFLSSIERIDFRVILYLLKKVFDLCQLT